MFIVYILCKNRKIFYRGCFCAFLAGQRSHLLIFIAVIYWLFPLFYLGQTFFAGKKGVSGPFYTGPFCAPISQKPHRSPRKAPTQKTPGASSTPKRAFGNTHPKGPPRAPRLYSAALFGMPPRTTKGPQYKSPGRKRCPKGPHAKTPGVIPGVWLMKSSFNLLLTHCGRFLAGCTGPACSRRPQ